MSEKPKLVEYSSSSSDEQASAPPVAVVKPLINPTQTEQPSDETPQPEQPSEEIPEEVELPRIDTDEPVPDPEVVVITSDSDTVSFITDTTLGQLKNGLILESNFM